MGFLESCIMHPVCTIPPFSFFFLLGGFDLFVRLSVSLSSRLSFIPFSRCTVNIMRSDGMLEPPATSRPESGNREDEEELGVGVGGGCVCTPSHRPTHPHHHHHHSISSTFISSFSSCLSRSHLTGWWWNWCWCIEPEKDSEPTPRSWLAPGNTGRCDIRVCTDIYNVKNNMKKIGAHQPCPFYSHNENWLLRIRHRAWF